MRFTIEREDKEKFDEMRQALFEEVITAEEAATIARICDHIVRQRSKVAPDEALSADTAMKYGRYLWVESEELRRLVCRKRLADVVVQLTGTRALRLGFDQLIVPEKMAQWNGKTLQELSSFQGVVAGLLISFDEPGQGLFLAPDTLLELEEEHALLIVYVRRDSRYMGNENDLHTHLPKKWGYALGGRLTDEKFPTLAR